MTKGEIRNELRDMIHYFEGNKERATRADVARLAVLVENLLARIENTWNEKMTRDYSRLPLPYTIAAWKVPIAVRMIVDAKMWEKLSYEVAVKINDAQRNHHDLVITKADLDSLPDDAWQYLESRLT